MKYLRNAWFVVAWTDEVAARMGDCEFWSLTPMLLSIDGASARVRGRLERFIAAEKVGAAPPICPLLARTA